MAKTLESALTNQQLVLKNFSGEHEVNATWSGTQFELEPPRWRVLGILTVGTLKLRGENLTLECVRHIAVRNDAGKVALDPVTSPVIIKVKLNGADPDVALPKLKDSLFYPSIDQALAAIPRELEGIIPARPDQNGAVWNPDNETPCDCADSAKTGCDSKNPNNGGVTPPKFVRGEDPQFSEQATGTTLSGYVRLGLTVDKQGHPTDVWVITPTAMDIDEEVAKSILTYVFTPATCHGAPISAFLTIQSQFGNFGAH